jgi:hypothetical protein
MVSDGAGLIELDTYDVELLDEEVGPSKMPSKIKVSS